MKTTYNFQPFFSRRERAQFIARYFQKAIHDSSSILDVGCSDNDLKKNIGNKVFGIDIGGHPDQIVDLEKDALSSFADNQFDMTVCTEVLEHIDNFYEVLDDLVRVSQKYVLISLPNCSDIWKLFSIVTTSKTGKFYGLPLEQPIDRHKWFFSLKDLESFFNAYCQKNHLTKKVAFAHFNYSNQLKGKFLKSLLKVMPLKLFASSYWILIKK